MTTNSLAKFPSFFFVMATRKPLEAWIDLIIVFEALRGGRFNAEAKESFGDQVREQDGGW